MQAGTSDGYGRITQSPMNAKNSAASLLGRKSIAVHQRHQHQALRESEVSKKPKRDERRKAREQKRNPTKIAIVALVFILTACGKQVEPDKAVDISIFKALFIECLKNVPKDINGADYRKTVSDCDYFAYSRSQLQP